MQEERPKSLRKHHRQQKKGAKEVEGRKQLLLMRGKKCSDCVLSYLRDMRSLRQRLAQLRSGGLEVHPFQNNEEVGRRCAQRECSLFMLGSHSKKKANNLVVGRLYDGQVLDMAELGLLSYKGVVEGVEVPMGVHPFVVFQGDMWESEEQFSKLRNLLHDVFHANQRTAGVDITEAMRMLVVFSLVPSRKIHMHVYEVAVRGNNLLTEEGTISLEELGPTAQFQLRRTKWAEAEAWKQAVKVRRVKNKKERKNVKYDEVGNKRGKIYVDRQNMAAMPTRKHKIINKEKLEYV